uniref:RIC3 domain-containing protein n=1 Tax=Globodera pallida TaxID=36090 RepID=A0A183CIQ6_GLOPA
TFPNRFNHFLILPKIPIPPIANKFRFNDPKINQIWFGTIAIVLLAIELKIGSGSGRPYGEGEAEKVKKLLTMHREKMKPAMDKLIEEQQKDEKLQSVLKKLNECRAKHSNESRTQTPSILDQSSRERCDKATSF